MQLRIICPLCSTIIQLFFYCLSKYHLVLSDIKTEMIRLYIDHMSQPSRAVHSLFLLTKTPFEIIQTRVAKFQNLTPDFLQLNPLGTLPFIHDLQSNVLLSESHSIMRYISRKSNQKDWYPIGNIKKMCKIDEYLDFHHCHTRKCHYYVINSLFPGRVKGKTDIDFNKEKTKRQVQEVLNKIQKIFFRNQSKQYVVGDRPSIADLSAYYELQFLILTGQNFQRWKTLKNWIIRMGKIKEVRQANEIFVNKLAPKINPDCKLF